MTETVTMSTLLTDVGTVFTTALGWVGDVGEAITSSPLLMLAVVGVPLVGLGIGIFKRLMRNRV